MESENYEGWRYDDKPPNYGLEEVSLNAMEYRFEQRIDLKWLSRLQPYRVREIVDETQRVMTLELRKTVYGINHPARHVIRYPANWLEALKERFAPAWILKRFPVEFIEIAASVQETYPDLKLNLPDNPAVLKFLVETNKNSNICW